jgi:mRNA interferase MazF
LVPDSVNNLNKDSVIDTFQVRSVSRERLIKRTGLIGDNDLTKVFEALKVVFGMGS